MLEYRLREKVMHGSFELPFSVYSVDYAHGKQQILPLHWHEEIEFIYIRSGSALFSVNHIEYAVQAGDCLIVNSGELHSGYANSLEGCSYSALVFKLSWLSALHPDRCQELYLNPLLRGELLFPALLNGQNAMDKAALDLIRGLMSDYTNQSAGYELSLKGHLFLLLSLLQSLLISKQHYDRSNLRNAYKWKNVINVLEHIDANYKLPLTLDELASVGSMSASHLCRLFKELTGLRPLEYINMLRVNSAALMIQSDNCTILDAAMENGFLHLSYFSKQFRKYKQVLPSEYKRKHGAYTACRDTNSEPVRV